MNNEQIFGLFNKHAEEIEFNGGYSGSVMLYDGFIKAITKALAERDARIKELEGRVSHWASLYDECAKKAILTEAELARIKDGANELPVIPVKRTASFESVDVVSTVDVILKSDLYQLMKGGE